MNFSKKNHGLLMLYKNKTNSIKNILSVSLAMAFIFLSCSSEDDGHNFMPSASDINIIIDEYPSNGTSIGMVSTNLTGALNYSITSQNVSGALKINAGTGQVTVDDGSKFDFETNPILEATISVTNSAETTTSLVSVELNNIDDIAHFLTYSKQAYLDANTNDWISVTEAEYITLATSLSNVTKSGITDDQIPTYSVGVEVAGTSANGISFANNNGATIPPNSYCFAFKYFMWGGNGANASKVKISSTSATTGYSSLGSAIPETRLQGYNYLILKGNDSAVIDTSYLAFYSFGMQVGYFISEDDTNYSYAFSDDSTIDVVGETESAIIMYQGLSTTVKQWD